MKRFLLGLMMASVAAIGFGSVTAFANNGDGAGTAFKATYPVGAIDGGASDFGGENGAVATSWTIVETSNADGTFTLDILAFYTS